jgi:hypothetical protein
MIFEFAGAYLGALEVLKEAERAVELGSDGTEPLYAV